LSARSADLLRKLLSVDSDEAESHATRESVSVQKVGADQVLESQDDGSGIRVHIPYFGVIKIARNGLSKEKVASIPAAGSSYQASPLKTTNTSTISDSNSTHGHHDGTVSFPPSTTDTRVSRINPSPSQVASFALAGLHEIVPSPIDATPLGANIAQVDPSHLATQGQLSSNVPPLDYEGYPELAACSDEWAFQGVDLAFFDSLMRNTAQEGDVNVDWANMGQVS
jgi:hypothetical protein